MTCDAALERMLEAEPAALRGEDGSALAQHIAGCDRCARAARVLLEEARAVDRTLADWAGLGDADAAAEAALRASRLQDAAAPADRSAHRAPRSWGRTAWIPLAAAAALAGVLVLSRVDTPFPAIQAPRGPGLEPTVSVAPPTDRAAAIMETENPNITIVWLYDREES